MGRECLERFEREWLKNHSKKNYLIIVYGDKDITSLPRVGNLWNKGLKGKSIGDNILWKGKTNRSIPA